MSCCNCKGVEIRYNEKDYSTFCQDCMPDENGWLVPVDKVPDPFLMDRVHAYVTPDNKVYALSHDRLRAIEITGGSGGGGSIDLSEYAKKSDIIDYKAGDKITIDSNTVSVSKEFSDKVDSIETKADEALAKEYKGSKLNNGWVEITDDRTIKLNQNFLYDNLKVADSYPGSKYLSLGELVNGYGLGIRFDSDSLRNDIVNSINIPTQKTKATLVESSEPTNIYSFKITPYASMIKKDNSLPAGDAQIIYNAAINPIYKSGIIRGGVYNIIPAPAKEFNLSWQQLFPNYGVLVTVSAKLKETDIYGKKTLTLGASNELYIATQDINDNLGYITKAGDRSKGKTVGNFTINNGISSARVDVTYYKIVLE